jgi:hypothetical protein
MSDFLNYLNTASLDALVKIPGITQTIAENIIAARPFASVDDCLNVYGVGKNLLARMQSNFEAEEKPSESRALIQVEEEAPPTYAKLDQPAKDSVKADGDSFLSRLGKAFLVFVRAFFRLIALALVIGGIGAALYYGLPYINQKVLVPIEKNSAQIKQVETEVQSMQTQLNKTNSRVDALEKSVESYSASLTKLDEIQAALENKIQASQDKTLLQLKQEVMFTRALDMLGRARLYLSQSNFGLAREDVNAARETLAELNDPANEEAIKRLDMVLGNLPAFPVVASGDLEIAWQILISGEAPVKTTLEPIFTSTPTIEPTLEVTPTATP